MRLPKHRQPTTPGQMLKRFLMELEITNKQLAQHLGWDEPRVSQIINGKRGITPETALCLAEALGTSPEMWLNAQAVLDMWKAKQTHKPVSKLVITKVRGSAPVRPAAQKVARKA